MKNIKAALIFFTLVSVSLASAYDDRAAIWHDDMVPNGWRGAFGTQWYSDLPDDRQAHIKAQREKEDREKKAKREYQDTQEKINRDKENRRSVTR